MYDSWWLPSTVKKRRPLAEQTWTVMRWSSYTSSAFRKVGWKRASRLEKEMRGRLKNWRIKSNNLSYPNRSSSLTLQNTYQRDVRSTKIEQQTRRNLVCSLRFVRKSVRQLLLWARQSVACWMNSFHFEDEIVQGYAGQGAGLGYFDWEKNPVPFFCCNSSATTRNKIFRKVERAEKNEHFPATFCKPNFAWCSSCQMSAEWIVDHLRDARCFGKCEASLLNLAMIVPLCLIRKKKSASRTGKPDKRKSRRE